MPLLQTDDVRCEPISLFGGFCRNDFSAHRCRVEPEWLTSLSLLLPRHQREDYYMSKVSSSITQSPPTSSQFAHCAKSHSRFSTCASELRRAPDVEAAFITRADAIIDVPFSRRPFRVSKRPHGSVAGSVKFIPSLRVSMSVDPRCDLPAAICVTIEA